MLAETLAMIARLWGGLYRHEVASMPWFTACCVIAYMCRLFDHTYVINNHGIMQRSFSIVDLEMTIFWPYKTNKVYKLSYIIRDNVFLSKKRELCVHAL